MKAFARLGGALAASMIAWASAATPALGQRAAVPPATRPAAPAAGETFAERLQSQIRGGVCRVIVSDGLGSPTASGSGFVVSADGFIITNYHVVDGAASATVDLPDSGLHLDAQLWQAWPTFDLALLRATVPPALANRGVAFAPLRLAAARPGLASDVWALGFPLSTKLGLTVTKGIVSGIRDRSELASLVDGAADLQHIGSFDPKICFVQIDSAINHGNSGGPLIDGDGAVIGVNTLALSSANSFYFAVSAEHVADLFAKRSPRAAGFSSIARAAAPVVAVRRPEAPDAAPPAVAAATPGVQIAFPTIGFPPPSDPFYANSVDPKPVPLSTAVSVARELAAVRLKACGACGGSGSIKHSRQVGTRVDGALTFPVMETTSTPCEKCRQTGKVPPSATAVRAVLTRLATAVSASPEGRSGRLDADAGPQAGELLKRVTDSRWDDLAAWGDLDGWARDKLKGDIRPGEPIVLAGRVAAIAPRAFGNGRAAVAVYVGTVNRYLITTPWMAYAPPVLGDRVVVIGVAGPQVVDGNVRLLAVDGGVMLPRP